MTDTQTHRQTHRQTHGSGYRVAPQLKKDLTLVVEETRTQNVPLRGEY